MSKVYTDNIEKRTGGTAMAVPATGKWPTANIADDAITADKLANSINTDIAANTAKVTNATHTGDVTGATALTIAVDAVDIAMLSATGSASASTFLRGDNSWAAVTAADNTPAFLARLSADQSIPNAAWTKLEVDDERYDTDSAYDNSSNYRFTVPVGAAGAYLFNFGTQYDSVSAANPTQTALYVNGTFETPRTRTANNFISGLGSTQLRNLLNSSIMLLAEGDYVELWTAHIQGSNQDAGGDETYFGGFKLAGVS